MISIGIIDDEQVYLDKIKDILITNFDDIKVYSYNSASKIDNDLDFILLDIDMPDIDGIIFSKQHRNYRIVFVTNYDTRIKEAFGPNVYGYVSKGNLEEELVEKVKEVIEVIKCDYYVTFKVNGIDINIRIDDIIYCQYLGNHIVSIVYHDKKININNSSLKKVKEVLNEYFIEISQDIIINKHRIINFEDRYVYLDGINSKFEVSVRKRKLVRKSFYETFR
ncbi:LytR/AlgR family response regulator transcription factor [Thomasclavelia ramosa]|uniref:LytR/AlgR family response regulator transcription factor n=1 Tax=Thomasclavelia ramosa TaxID=1547 RepID=UPI0022E02768|nr:response regulator [Thomasclavelia ramosa]